MRRRGRRRRGAAGCDTPVATNQRRSTTGTASSAGRDVFAPPTGSDEHLEPEEHEQQRGEDLVDELQNVVEVLARAAQTSRTRRP